ncbi:hypothetical protein PY257_03760 [Ramlibacter sp. H39-3-26]|uniref:hypothetical protein n=1 Tax=Curvibacter soli TaxID=3031331 RepID=UPI0023D9EAA7|nr:hypothetical protein [Ramlibacter sp. H39-3-26]MDF1484301.1 hypothetical protein [Ramlibacter sp. H39-3-26]
MAFIKTEAGQLAFKERQGSMTPRQRAAFILFDGKRSLDDVLAATAAMGITQADVQAMIDQGLLAPMQGGAAPAAAPAPGSGRTPQQRYQDAYPLATQLTAGLGLRGLRLNLAVEAVGSYAELLALAPKIRDAVGADKYTPLERALKD